MAAVRIALANLRFPRTREESVALAVDAVARAGAGGALVVSFPECYVPGYRREGMGVAPPDAAFLERAWSEIGGAAAGARVAVALGTERVVNGAPVPSVLVFGPDGALIGYQDKVQLDPSEDGIYAAGSGRRVFTVGPLTFGFAICHEGWRYPETVRAAARAGAQVVFHPHYHWAEPGDVVPTRFADPENSFHEKAALCRAAENTCWFATVNYASENSPTTSAVVRPDGRLLVHQPYGLEGLLVADVDLSEATGLLARRWKPAERPAV